MGFKALSLLVFPLVVMAVFVLISPGGVLAGTSQVTNCTAGSTNCLGTPTPSAQTFYCPNSGVGPFPSGDCQISTVCINNVSPAFCYPFPISLIDPGTWLHPGDFVTISAAAQVGAGGAVFSFSSLGTSGFITMIGVAVSVAVIGGLTIFGSGLQSESIHILFMGALLTGVWLILAGLEGVGSSGDIFAQLNAGIIGAGSAFFGILTLCYALGIVGSVSRGGG
jgi:hypothetical protein